jgi:ribonuclease HI
MTKVESIPRAENIMNAELSKISAWAKGNKLKFNEQKSQVMLMSRQKRKENKEVKIYLNNKPLIQVRSIKYLGIIFEHKLTFREHINYMAEKCKKLIFSLSKSAKLNWGLQHAALKTIYTEGIQPLLLYGAPVWNKAIDIGRNKHRLIRVQRLINMKIAKAYRTVSNAALCILTGVTPITIKIEEASQYYHIIRSDEKEDTKVETKIGTQYWQHPADTITLLPETTKDTSTIQVFTDSSKSEKGVGAGIAIYKFSGLIKSLKYKLNIRCTNNQAEQLAILKALQYMVNIHAAVKTATVYTDSRITLDSLKNNGIHRALLEKIRQQLTEMKKMQWHIQFCWVKAHVSVLGNETADTLAKEVATGTDTPECYDKVPISVVKSELEVLSVKKWQRECDQSTKGHITKQYFPDITARLNMKLNLTNNFTLMVTGHSNRNSYLHHFKIRGTPSCPCGAQDQTIDHLFFECELLWKE